MKHKISWILVLIISGSIFVWFSFQLFLQTNKYIILNTPIKANIEKLEVNNDNKNKFLAVASYSFDVANKTFIHKGVFEKKFINPLSAKAFCENISKNDFIIWYNSKNPNFSSVEKNFPIKNCVYSIITLIVFIYFLILKYYILGFQKND